MSNSLEFTVEKSTKSLIGSAMSGEGLVNVFRGTGKVLLAPVRGDDFFGDLQAEIDGQQSDSVNSPSSQKPKGALGALGAVMDFLDD